RDLPLLAPPAHQHRNPLQSHRAPRSGRVRPSPIRPCGAGGSRQSTRDAKPEACLLEPRPPSGERGTPAASFTQPAFSLVSTVVDRPRIVARRPRRYGEPSPQRLATHAPRSEPAPALHCQPVLVGHPEIS